MNAAARLEGANKYLGTSICVSAATVGLANMAPVRPAAELLLQRKSTPLAVFEPLRENTKATLNDYLLAYELLREL